MKYKLTTIILIYFILTNIVYGSQPTVTQPFDSFVKFLTLSYENKLVSFSLNVIPNYDCSSVSLVGVQLENVSSSNLIEKEIPVIIGKLTTINIDINLPNEELGGFDFYIEGCNYRQKFTYYFAAMQDTVLKYHYKPHKSYQEIKEQYENPQNLKEGPNSIKRREEEARIKKLMSEPQEQWITNSEGEHIQITEANQDSVYNSLLEKNKSKKTALDVSEHSELVLRREGNPDTLMTRRELYEFNKQLKDSLVVMKNKDGSYSIRDIEKPLTQLEKMKELEKSPLEDAEIQSILVNGIIYTRNKGEDKFHEKGPSSTMSKITHYDARIDSIGKSLEGEEFDYVIDLRDPQDFEFVKKYLDTLEETIYDGFYISKIPKDIRIIFRKSHINAFMLRNFYRENRIKKIVDIMKEESNNKSEDEHKS